MKNQEKEAEIEQEIHIALWFNLATAKLGLNEIIYRLRELKAHFMLRIPEQVLVGYDDLISERLSRTDISPNTVGKGEPKGPFCSGRKIRKRG
ncbi:MAG: hypothetical protein JSW12_18235 [Deltaproteobacteria bacterium]|nr:MAG: hypothetical protein JSW12_18235 [Deltaproteobacteria bacterium]